MPPHKIKVFNVSSEYWMKRLLRALYLIPLADRLFIPFSSRQAVQHMLRRRRRDGLCTVRSFLHLISITEENRKVLAPEVRLQLRYHVLVRVLGLRLMMRTAIIYTLVAILFAILLSVCMPAIMGAAGLPLPDLTEANVLTGTLASLFGYLSLLGMVVVVTKSNAAPERSQDWMASILITVACMLLLAGAYRIAHSWWWYLPHYLVYATMGFTLGGSILFGGVMLVIPSMILSLRSVERRNLCVHPVCRAIPALIRLLAHLERDPLAFSNSGKKKSMIDDLEQVADTFEKFIPASTPDQQGFSAIMASRASWIRSLKMWVLCPRADTRDHLVPLLALTLVALLRGHWDAIPTGSVENPPRLPWHHRSLAMLRSVIWAFVPLGILLVLQYTPLALQGTMREYATLGVTLWCAIALVADLDPKFGTRTAFVRSITEIMAIWRKP